MKMLKGFVLTLLPDLDSVCAAGKPGHRSGR